MSKRQNKQTRTLEQERGALDDKRSDLQRRRTETAERLAEVVELRTALLLRADFGDTEAREKLDALTTERARLEHEAADLAVMLEQCESGLAQVAAAIEAERVAEVRRLNAADDELRLRCAEQMDAALAIVAVSWAKVKELARAQETRSAAVRLPEGQAFAILRGHVGAIRHALRALPFGPVAHPGFRTSVAEAERQRQAGTLPAVEAEVEEDNGARVAARRIIETAQLEAMPS